MATRQRLQLRPAKSFVRTSLTAFPLLTILCCSTLLAQEEFSTPSRFGLLAGVNYNNASLDAAGILGYAPDAPLTTTVDKGTGLAGYGGLLYEYVPGTFGFHIRGTYDDRSAAFGDNDEVEGTLRYISIEPALRITPANPNLHFLLGPSLNLLVSNNLAYTSTTSGVAVSPAIDTASNTTFGVWGGVGYDIALSQNVEKKSAWYLTPFVSAHWMPSQVDNTLRDWSSVTVRGGLQLKYGFGKSEKEEVVETPTAPGGVDLVVRTPPGGLSEQRRLEEFLPLLNYMFFPSGETALPAKYEKLTPAQGQRFDERTMLDRETPTTGAAAAASRSQRQLEVYYNMANIIGARMRDNPSSKITLVGAAPNTADAQKMADDAKNYLVNTFGIDPARIATKGQTRPPHASGTRNTPKEDKDLIGEENLRVEVLTDDPELLKPVKINAREEEPLENDVLFDLNLTSATSVSSWDLTVTGDDGFSQTYGPFYGKAARVNATPMLGDRDEGTFTATVNATTHDGGTLTEQEEFELIRKRQPLATGTRYSILFEYDDSKSVKTYESFLRTEVAPRIPNNSTVFIHGHTDVTGKDDYNAELSAKRAVEAQKILADELKKLGREVTFDAYGFGETRFRAPFGNESSEERYYNRTVMIEIIPES